MSSIDVRKSLYDTDGYRHTLVQATPVQILTLLEGFYWLWDRMSGLCLVEGMTGMRLTNTRPPREDVRARRQPVAETRAFLMAQDAVHSASASAARATQLQAMFTDAGYGQAGPAAPALQSADLPPAPAREVPGAVAAASATTIHATAAAQPARPAAPVSGPADAGLRRAPRPSALGALLVVGLMGLALLLPTAGRAGGEAQR